eukprot:CAMPEP_0178992236 /NCGR_PEP_ID=MMETSP0795-20121207/5993_1 /TAXON_ID=88552 /ORGANISM="Amoebophrya sp., Strain Ameob2" /LENGTH=37 /DNA_ID= /DNA_START= /DNA_END= /DNA_ORIENTATION=
MMLLLHSLAAVQNPGDARGLLELPREGSQTWKFTAVV